MLTESDLVYTHQVRAILDTNKWNMSLVKQITAHLHINVDLTISAPRNTCLSHNRCASTV